MRELILGSRGSALALWQAEHVRSRLLERHPGLAIRVDAIKTLGDRVLDAPLSQIGDKGLFTKEIEQALLEARIDVAVHSLKDLPTILPGGLALGAVTKREDPRDAFIPHASNPVRSLKGLPERSVIATGSLRRRSQVLSYRPDFTVEDVRGNLNTRLAKLDRSSWSGMILAVAGVKRLGWSDRIAETIPESIMLPAVGQGALALEIRSDDARTEDLIRLLHDAESSDGVTAERSFLRRVEGGCQIPVGTYARVEGDSLVMDAFIGSLDGRASVRRSARGPRSDPASLGAELAEKMLADGGAKILNEIRDRSTT